MIFAPELDDIRRRDPRLGALLQRLCASSGVAGPPGPAGPSGATGSAGLGGTGAVLSFYIPGSLQQDTNPAAKITLQNPLTASLEAAVAVADPSNPTVFEVGRTPASTRSAGTPNGTRIVVAILTIPAGSVVSGSSGPIAFEARDLVDVRVTSCAGTGVPIDAVIGAI